MGAAGAEVGLLKESWTESELLHSGKDAGRSQCFQISGRGGEAAVAREGSRAGGAEVDTLHRESMIVRHDSRRGEASAQILEVAGLRILNCHAGQSSQLRPTCRPRHPRLETCS